MRLYKKKIIICWSVVWEWVWTVSLTPYLQYVCVCVDCWSLSIYELLNTHTHIELKSKYRLKKIFFSLQLPLCASSAKMEIWHMLKFLVYTVVAHRSLFFIAPKISPSRHKIWFSVAGVLAVIALVGFVLYWRCRGTLCSKCSECFLTYSLTYSLCC